MADNELTRRRFLKGASAGVAAAAAGCGEESGPADAGNADGGMDDVSTGDVASDAASDIGAEDVTAPDEGGAEPSGVVVSVVAAKSSLVEQIRQAVAMAGGLDAIQPGQSVFLKVNAVHPFGVGGAIASTPDFVLAVIELVKERDPGTIIVGDRSARFFESPYTFDLLGLTGAAADAGVELYAAPKPADDPDAWVLRQPEGWEETWSEQGGVQVMKKLLEVDHVINLPVCKNHRWAVFSLALKNFIGGIGDESRDPMHYKEGEPDELSRDIAVLNGAFETTLNILDARRCLVNGGPEGVDADAVFTEPGYVLASADRVALDAMGVSLLQLERAGVEVSDPDATSDVLTRTNPWQMPQIVHAIDLGLGVSSSKAVTTAFDGVRNSAALQSRFSGQS